MARFEGKTVFVAGGSSGINLEIARAFGVEGARVALLSRNKDKIDAAVDELAALGIQTHGYACDVRNADGLACVFEATETRFGKIDVVVSGAAGNFLAPAHALTPNGFKTVIDIDLLGTFNVFRTSYEHLKRPGAVLIAITAGQAVHPMPMQIHACAAKAGVNMVTKCLALEWGSAGVRVNAISPGPISDTEGMARLAPNEAAEAALKGRLALRRYGTKSEIADAALFLASDAAGYITGTILNVDGGNDLGNASFDALSSNLGRS